MIDFILSILACGISSLIFIVFANKIPTIIFQTKEKKKEKLKIILLTIITSIYLLTFYIKYKNFVSLLNLYLSMNITELILVIIMNTCLFSYVIAYQIFDDDCQDLKKKLKGIFSYRFFKILILAPLYEEFYFRLIFRFIHIFIGNEKYGVLFIIFSSIFFAVSHSTGDNLRENIQIWVITFIFGLYSNIVFYRTENLFCAIFLHFYCNLMGPPLPPSKYMDKDKKQLLYFLLGSGIVCFFVLITYL